MIFDARSVSRRWTTVTCEANRVRKIASSIAESPPPTTAIGLPRKKKPSQVAQVDTPWPISARSDGRPSSRADAPVAMISVAGRELPSDGRTANGRVQVDGGDVAADDLGAEALRLGAHLRHQLRPHDAVAVTRASSRPAS